MDLQTSSKTRSDKLLAATAIAFELYRKAHVYHFNAKGTTFTQDHEFLLDTYEELNGQFDDLGELCRQNGFLVPLEIESYSTLPQTNASEAGPMVMYDDLIKQFEVYKFALADVQGEWSAPVDSGTRASVENIMSALSKRTWMLRAMYGIS